jgi:hypothetical protein
MSSCCDTVTPSRFERRLPPGRLEPIFKAAFGTFGKAAVHLGVARQTIARWARLTPPPPRWVLDALKDPVQQKIAQAHAAEFELNILLKSPLPPPRPLSGCTAKYARREKRPW